MKTERPIAVFDSGIGGLIVVRALRRALPGESIVYLGDTARVPYGPKSHNTIERYVLQAGEFLQRCEPKLVVIACNTASAHGLQAIQAASSCPVIGAIEPSAQIAAEVRGAVGVIGTLATIDSGAYVEAIHRRNPDMEIHSVACPLLANLAEEGWIDDPITDSISRRYLNLLPFQVKTIVLGCTHYQLLLPSLSRSRPDTRWIDSSEGTAKAVDRVLQGSVGYRTGSARGDLRTFLTDVSPRLQEVGERFLGEPLGSVELVEI